MDAENQTQRIKKITIIKKAFLGGFGWFILMFILAVVLPKEISDKFSFLFGFLLIFGTIFLPISIAAYYFLKDKKHTFLEATLTNIISDQILKKALLATICCWILVSIFLIFILPSIFSVEGIRLDKQGIETIEGKIAEQGVIKWVSSSLISNFVFPYQFFFLPFILVGFYLGIKYFGKGKRKSIFIFPLSFLMPSFIFSLYITFAADFGAVIFIFTIPYLFFSFLISSIFFLKREQALFLTVICLFIIFIFGFTIYAKNLEVKGLEKTARVKLVEESILIPTKEEAIKTNNFELCKEIERQIEKLNYPPHPDYELKLHYYDPCIEEIAINSKDYDLCNNISNDISKIDYCDNKLSAIDYFLNETKLCKDVSVINDKKKCIREIALNTNNAELCRKIFDIACIKEIAVRTNNPAVCGAFPIPTFKQIEHVYGGLDDRECQIIVSSALNNFEICNNVWGGKNSRYSMCIPRVAINTNNPNLCSEIFDEFFRRECYKNFQK